MRQQWRTKHSKSEAATLCNGMQEMCSQCSVAQMIRRNNGQMMRVTREKGVTFACLGEPLPFLSWFQDLMQAKRGEREEQRESETLVGG